MEVTGQIHIPAALNPWKMGAGTSPIGAMWNPELVRTLKKSNVILWLW
jgi:hypothetical protein